MMYVLPPHLISLSLRSRLLQLRSPISTYPLPNPWVIRPPRSSLPSACSSAASLSSRSKTRTRPYRASITMARRLPESGHSGPYSSAAPQFMLVERSSRSTGSFLRLAETAGRISLRGVRFDPPVSALASFTSVPSFAQVSDPAEPLRDHHYHSTVLADPSHIKVRPTRPPISPAVRLASARDAAMPGWLARRTACWGATAGPVPWCWRVGWHGSGPWCA